MKTNHLSPMLQLIKGEQGDVHMCHQISFSTEEHWHIPHSCQCTPAVLADAEMASILPAYSCTHWHIHMFHALALFMATDFGLQPEDHMLPWALCAQ